MPQIHLNTRTRKRPSHSLLRIECTMARALSTAASDTKARPPDRSAILVSPSTALESAATSAATPASASTHLCRRLMSVSSKGAGIAARSVASRRGNNANKLATPPVTFTMWEARPRCARALRAIKVEASKGRGAASRPLRSSVASKGPTATTSALADSSEAAANATRQAACTPRSSPESLPRASNGTTSRKTPASRTATCSEVLSSAPAWTSGSFGSTAPSQSPTRH
mmetsp:Transcript_146459/g.469878  ORF Transcript_146459/g.469878 Transcript_146459/m.469878 type:complete len:228 (-) Transcript_146459:231-914(-)